MYVVNLLLAHLVPLDQFERLTEFVRQEIRARRYRRVAHLSGGQAAVVLIVLVSTHPGSAVGTHQAAGGRAQETFT